ncbi:MAG: hypothetical protein WBM81_08220 [Sedimenticolaceae bacterium]
MTDENSKEPKNVVAESNRLSEAITQLFVEEKTSAGTGVIALAISIGNAIRQFLKPDDLEANLARTIETIRRVASGQPPTN